MGLNTVLEAAQVGFATFKLSGGAGLTDTTLLAALLTAGMGGAGATAYPDGVRGADIYIAAGTTGAVYYENNGNAATANTQVLDVGTTLRIRNSLDLMKKLHLFATGTYDIRVTLWG